MLVALIGCRLQMYCEGCNASGAGQQLRSSTSVSFVYLCVLVDALTATALRITAGARYY